MEERNARKVLQGVVVSNKMQKTAVVKGVRKVRHPKYGKLIERWKKYHAHMESPVEIGASVKIMSCRPLSKLKRWRIVS